MGGLGSVGGECEPGVRREGRGMVLPGGGSCRQPRRNGVPTTEGIGSGREGVGGNLEVRDSGTGGGLWRQMDRVVDGGVERDMGGN